MKRSLPLKYWTSLLPQFYGLGIELVEMDQCEGWQKHTFVCLSLQFRNIDGADYGCVINWTWNRSTLAAAKWWSDKIFFLYHFHVLPMLKAQFIKSSFFRYKNDDDCFEGLAPQILSAEIIIKMLHPMMTVAPLPSIKTPPLLQLPPPLLQLQYYQ